MRSSVLSVCIVDRSRFWNRLMNGVGIFELLAGVLQLVIPSYALRLVRRFGAQHVGWFLVAAFGSLAAVHLATAGSDQPSGSGIGLDLVVAAASGLLVIGMGHLETLLAERQRTEREAQELERRIAVAVTERTAELSAAGEKMQQEIARRERQEKILRDSEMQYRALFTEHPQPMMIVDLRTLKFVSVNHAAARLYGFATEDLFGMTIRDLVPIDGSERLQAELARPCLGAQSRGVWQLRKRDLSLAEVEITSVDVKFGGAPARLFVAVDVSQTRRRETELKQANKNDLVRRMAGEFAGRFEKILATIDGRMQELLSQPQDTGPLRSLMQISAATNRAGSMIAQLRAASGRQDLRVEPIDLNGAISNSSAMLKRVIGDKITLEMELGQGLPTALTDPRVVEQLLISLASNARDAMPRGGTLTIQTAAIRFDKSHAQQRPGTIAGDFVRLSIRDTGCGISAAAQEHLFEPFFSTQNSDSSDGLGLASIWGAVNQEGGWIEFTTQPGVGTTFHVHLPCAHPAASAASDAGAVAQSAVRGSVLLVEPDDRIRGLARFGLNRNGYHVIEADCADTVLHLWEGKGAKVDLLVLDARLAGDSNGGLAQKLRETRPELRMVFTVPGEVDTQDMKLPSIPGVESLPKPYTIDQLLQAVKAAWPKTARS